MLGSGGAEGHRSHGNRVEEHHMNESFVTVVGNVVSDPISRPTKVGRPFASLRIASTTRRWDAEKRAFVVYGRLRVNQWETEKGEPRTSAEIDAFTIGHDLTRGQVEFSRPPRVQLDTNDRLADPAIQDTFHGEAAGADGSDESGMRGVEEDSTDEGVVVQGGFGQSGFGRRVEDADTDDYVVVNGG
jgi:single-strand DNA-binding protein